ncbi:MAG: acyl-CoA dehydrogenase [Desulfobacterales bacterium]|nr:acyl-CoA dehydrogenase [Desulfobacterales bacterium]
MAQLISDRRDIDFVLYEQMGVEALLKTEKYADMNRKMFDMIVSEARNFGIKEILPTYAEGDRQGIRFENGQVLTPDCFRRPHQLYVENEWLAMTEDPEYGGQGLPHVIAQAASEYLVGASFAFTAYGTLGHGAGKMVEIFGTEEQKKLFLKNLYTGHWGGSMLLTEPNAGSDVGALTTTAKKNDDGTYSISGNKIFITNGDQDLTENIIHPVLARIEGAPGGTKGISIFLVPKYWVHPDGSIGEFNDVVCTGVEEKMGLHGSPTCSLTLGGKAQCRGLLLGQENQGMRVMFHMMNEARLDVGVQGFLHGSAAYMYAVNYARERLQGRDLAAGKDPDAGQVPIIRHPDVRRMLMWMKANVEGMRSFVYFVAHCFDKAECATDETEKARCTGLIELLTPLVKSYCSDKGFDVCVQAMQVYGGYGYTQEYPVEQLTRDCKITSIYEGTNGIQAMDLLGRKLGMKKGAVFMGFLEEIQQTISLARKVGGLEPLADALEGAAGRLGDTALNLGKTAASEKFRTAFSFALPFLDAMGDVIMAWMLLWRAAVAMPKLEKLLDGLDDEARAKKIQSNKNAAFYDGVVKTARYYIRSVLPVAIGKMAAISGMDDAMVEMDEKSFGGL